MNRMQSVVFEGKPCPVLRVKIENRIDPPPPHQSGFPIPKPPPGVMKRGQKAVGAWLEKQMKPYQSAVAEWERRWEGKTRFLNIVEIGMPTCKWRGHFMGQPGGAKFSGAALIGAEILPDGALRLANGKGIRGVVEDLPAIEILANRERLDARGERKIDVSEAVEKAARRGGRMGAQDALRMRDCKTRRKGPKSAYDAKTIRDAVAEIKRLVKQSKGKLGLSAAVQQVRTDRNLWKMTESYLRRECYERKRRISEVVHTDRAQTTRTK